MTDTNPYLADQPDSLSGTNYRNPREDRDLFSMLGHQAKATSTKKGINKLNEVIDWELLCSDLESILGYDKRDRKKGGLPPFRPRIDAQGLGTAKIPWAQ